jgi:hypothetical protein
MKIDTDEWIALADACKLAGIPQPTGYRMAKRLGIVENFFGVACILKRDVSTLEKNRRTPGNPNWIESWEGAAADGAKGTPARIAKRSPRTGKR